MPSAFLLVVLGICIVLLFTQGRSSTSPREIIFVVSEQPHRRTGCAPFLALFMIILFLIALFVR